MSLRRRAWQLPLRLAAGSFVLNSGLSKRDADEATATQLHGFASGTYPMVGELDPRTFVKTLSTGEIALGTALLLPFVPGAVAGAALASFATGLIGLYLSTPGMRQQGSVRPTDQGIPLAKDVWLLGIGTSLVIGDLVGQDDQ